MYPKLPVHASTDLRPFCNFPEMAHQLLFNVPKCAKITLLSNYTRSPLRRRQGEVPLSIWRGQGEIEMAHEVRFSVPKCAKITLLSNCTPSPLTRRGQGEVEMASAGWRTKLCQNSFRNE
jgi:hypothetical protein